MKNKEKIKNNKSNSDKNVANEKCRLCENFNKVNGLCKRNHNCNAEFSKCDNFLIKNTLVNF